MSERERTKYRSEAQLFQEQLRELDGRNQQLQHQTRELAEGLNDASKAKKENARLMERNHIHENTLSSLRKTIEDLITSKTGLAAALEQQTMKVARLDEMNRISQVEAEKSQCEVNDVRQSLAEMRELNARLREKVDEEIIGRASRHCQRAEALDKSFEHGSLTRRGPQEDSLNIKKSTEAPNYDTQENERHEAHVASTLGHSYALIE